LFNRSFSLHQTSVLQIFDFFWRPKIEAAFDARARQEDKMAVSDSGSGARGSDSARSQSVYVLSVQIQLSFQFESAKK
jgi:hypothetical protein